MTKTLQKEIIAPWTDDQVMRLNRWQDSDWVHPYACPNRNNHPQNSKLKATVDGWVCPYCGYTQNWAHKESLDPPTRGCWKNN